MGELFALTEGIELEFAGSIDVVGPPVNGVILEKDNQQLYIFFAKNQWKIYNLVEDLDYKPILSSISYVKIKTKLTDLTFFVVNGEKWLTVKEFGANSFWVDEIILEDKIFTLAKGQNNVVQIFNSSNLTFNLMGSLSETLTKAIKDKSHNIPNYIPKNFLIFNPSFAKLGEDDYLVCARITFSLNEDVKLTPGNNPLCLNAGSDVSGNFMWNRWKNRDFFGSTCFFRILSGVTSLLTYKQHVDGSSGYDPKDYVLLNILDCRLATIKNKIFVHSNDLGKILQVDFSQGNLVLLYWFYTNSSIVDLGINMMLIERNKKGLTSYLDWYYDEGVKIKIITKKENKEKIIRTEYPIVGTGSWDTGLEKDKLKYGINYGIMPLFSFSTPYIIYKDWYLAVGHVKIHTDEDNFPYLAGSNIQSFRKFLYDELKRLHGHQYVKHLGTIPVTDFLFKNQPQVCKGYIYLCYFYILDKELNKMFISDAFLPYPKSNQFDWIFSLIFPSGLTLIEDNLIITAGYGDTYPVSITCNVEEAFNACYHDVSNIKMEDYQYFILRAE